MIVQKVIQIPAKRMSFELNWRPRISTAWTARIGIDNGNMYEIGSRANCVFSNGQKRPEIIQK